MSETRDQSLVDERVAQVRAAVQTWTGHLIDLGGRNQLLYYRDLKVGTLDLAGAHSRGGSRCWRGGLSGSPSSSVARNCRERSNGLTTRC